MATSNAVINTIHGANMYRNMDFVQTEPLPSNSMTLNGGETSEKHLELTVETNLKHRQSRRESDKPLVLAVGSLGETHDSDIKQSVVRANVLESKNKYTSNNLKGTGTERSMGMSNKSHLSYLTEHVGTKLIRAFFTKRVNESRPKTEDPDKWTVDIFLNKNFETIKSSKYYRQSMSIIFPVEGGDTNLDLWDLSLFLKVLKTTSKLSRKMEMRLSQLKKIRNKLAHFGDANIDDTKYKIYLEQISITFDDVLDEINDEKLSENIREMLQKADAGEIPDDKLAESLQALHRHWEELSNTVKSEHKETRHVVEKGNRELGANIASLKELLSDFKVNQHQIEVKLNNKNITTEMDQHLSHVMVDMFSEEIKKITGSYDTPDEQKMREAVHTFYRSLKENGYEIVKAEEGCILLHIQLSSFTSLLSFYADYIDGSLDIYLLELQKAAGNFLNCQEFLFEMNLYEEEFLEVIANIRDDMERTGIPRTGTHQHEGQQCIPTKEIYETDGGRTSVLLTVKPPLHFEREDLERILDSESKPLINAFNLPANVGVLKRTTTEDEDARAVNMLDLKTTGCKEDDNDKKQDMLKRLLSIRNDNLQTLKTLEKGDMVRIEKYLYNHYGIYDEDGYMYHLTGPSEVQFGNGGLEVKRELLLEVAGKWKAFKDNTRDNTHKPLKPEQAIRVAKSYVENMSKSYDLLQYNCEMWACMIRYGKGISFQVPKYCPMTVTVARKEQLRQEGSLSSATSWSQFEREIATLSKMATFRRVIDSEEDDDDNPEITSANVTSKTAKIYESDKEGNVSMPIEYQQHVKKWNSVIGEWQQKRPVKTVDRHNTSDTKQVKDRQSTILEKPKGNIHDADIRIVSMYSQNCIKQQPKGVTKRGCLTQVAVEDSNITSVTTAICTESDQRGNVSSPRAYQHHATRSANDIDKGEHRPSQAFDRYNISCTTQIKDKQPTRPCSKAELEKPTSKHGQDRPVSSHDTEYKWKKLTEEACKPLDESKAKITPKGDESLATAGAAKRDCNYENQELFLRPMCLVSTDKDGKFKIETDVLEQIKSVEVPVVVIAIVGLYRTGKSYLMNRLAGVSEGFPLGNTTDSATKGIWAWCRKHPKRENTVLLLLDTEGIGDPIKGDVNHDIKLITLAALLCNVLVYNIMTAFNQDAIERLTFISEISKSIQFKNSAYSCKQKDQESLILPILVVCVRDFSLMLPKKDGNEITQDEYLESTLELKDGKSTEIVRFNKPREGIMKYFPHRKCFTFDRPGDREQMHTLEKVDINKLSKSFIKDTETFLLYMFEQKPKVLLHSKPVTGQMFTSLVDTYVSAIRKGGIPDVDDAITNMAKIENERLKKILVKTFRDNLNNLRLPVLNTKNLEQIYQDHQKAILTDFRKEAVFNIEKVEQEIVDEMDKMWIEKKNQNLKMVKDHCSQELNKIYKNLVGEPDQYYKVGGYREYKSKMVNVRKSYETQMADTDRITVHEVLNEFIVKQTDTEQLILISDSEMTDAERRSEISTMLKNNREELKTLQNAHEKKLEDEKKIWEKHKTDLDDERKEYERKQQQKYDDMVANFKQDLKDMETSQTNKLTKLTEQNKELKDKIDDKCLIM